MLKGRMLEEMVLLEVNRVIPKNKEALKFKFDAGGTYDLSMLCYFKATKQKLNFKAKMFVYSKS